MSGAWPLRNLFHDSRRWTPLIFSQRREECKTVPYNRNAGVRGSSMKDESKTKAQLIAELHEMRRKATEMEAGQMVHLSAQGALLESAAAAIVIINESGCIVLVNQGAEDMFGY